MDGGSIFFVITMIAIYFLPSIIAGVRDHRNGASIAILNLLLGWTLVGWVVALAWSVSAKPPRPTGANTKPDISTRKPEVPKGAARVLLGKSTDERVTRCPHCKQRQPVSFEDARREKVTCQKCWKTFPIYVP